MTSATNISVAQEVKDLSIFDPKLGAYSFDDLGQVVQFADLMSKAGPMIPEHCQNQPAICMAITMRATHWGFDPFALAQETLQTKANSPIAYSAKVFVAALKNCAGVTLQYRYEGSYEMLNEPAKSAKGNIVAQRNAAGNRRCIAFAEIDGVTKEYTTPELDQITIKNSALWHNDPDQQLAYYAGRGWTRRNEAGVVMGAYSTDEVESMEPMRDVPLHLPKAALQRRQKQPARQLKTNRPLIRYSPRPKSLPKSTRKTTDRQNSKPTAPRLMATGQMKSHGTTPFREPMILMMVWKPSKTALLLPFAPTKIIKPKRLIGWAAGSKPRRRRADATAQAHTPLQRAAIFQAHEGICHICGEKIDGTREAWELEHIVAYELTNDDSDENLAPAHVSCHKRKTRKDKGQIAKAKRVHAKHIGAHQSKHPIPGSKGSKFKRKVDGTVVPR